MSGIGDHGRQRSRSRKCSARRGLRQERQNARIGDITKLPPMSDTLQSEELTIQSTHTFSASLHCLPASAMSSPSARQPCLAFQSTWDATKECRAATGLTKSRNAPFHFNLRRLPDRAIPSASAPSSRPAPGHPSSRHAHPYLPSA